MAGLEADATAVANGRQRDIDVGRPPLGLASAASKRHFGPHLHVGLPAATRWNAFIALAVAEKLFGAVGLSLTALVMALLIIPINFYNIAVLTCSAAAAVASAFSF